MIEKTTIGAAARAVRFCRVRGFLASSNDPTTFLHNQSYCIRSPQPCLIFIRMRPGIRLVHHTDLCPAVTTGTAACTTIVRHPDRARLAVYALLPATSSTERMLSLDKRPLASSDLAVTNSIHEKISHARLPVGLRRTEDPNIPETESTLDPVTAVAIAMTFDGAHHAPLLPGGGDQPTGIATVRAIAPQDTTAEAGATVAAAAAVLAVADNPITGTKAER